jgi:hypothetical protein
MWFSLFAITLKGARPWLWSADGMIVAASTTLLADFRSGQWGVAMPWALLVFGSVASLVANVAVAELMLIGCTSLLKPQ